MPPPKRYTEKVGDLIGPLRTYFGSPRHAYDLLQLAKVGVGFQVFYRAWRENKTTKKVKRALTWLVPALMDAVRESLVEWKEPKIVIDDWHMSQAKYFYENAPPGEEEDEDE